MEKARKPKRVFRGLDKWSTFMLIALAVVGGVLILVDAVLIAGFLMQSRGILPSGWLARNTPVVAPSIQIAPPEGMPGTTVIISGQGWRADETLVIELTDPTNVCPPQVVAMPNAERDGRFRDSFVLPAGTCWTSLSRVVIDVRSLEGDARAMADFWVLSAPQTPTPTATWTPVVEPTATTSTVVTEPTVTATSTPMAEPTTTSTPTVEPTVTATLTPVIPPTSTPTRVVWPTATPTVAIVDWRGEYFDNVSLTGMAQVIRNDRDPRGTLGIDFDWGMGAPVTGVPVDGFSSRWTRTINFDQGLYRFRAVVDDGLRLFVDGDLVIDQWRDGGRREVAVDRRMTAGRHTLRVEYYERTGAALVQLRWEKVTSYPDWKGEYWTNVYLQGAPAVVRGDAGPAGKPGLDFNWGQASPISGIPADGFSARWTRSVALDAGTYRFHALVDDGVRLWVNDRRIIDAWADHNLEEFVTDWTVTQGTYTLKVEYYERIGNARIAVWWEKIAPPNYPDWKGEYYPNRALSGEMVLLRNDREINFKWGPGAPASSLPTDSFSARWTRQAHFDAAVYRFHALVDDGVRLWVDGQLLIDKWQDREPTEFTVDRNMTSGTHSIKVEYYEHTGGAQIRVWWDKLSVTYPDWKGEYWGNRDLSGSPSLVRNDRNLDFNWGPNAPAAGLPKDNLSARWTRQVTFQPGVYRFYASADDGVRAALDGKWIINEWHDAGNEIYSADVSLDGAPRQVKVEYYERGGNARVRFWWQRIGDLPTPAPVTRVQFSSAVYTVDEGSGTATIAVLLSAASDRTVKVSYATSGGSATPGSDYAAINGTLTFNPGVTSQTFAVSIVDDTADEADETVVLALSNPSNAQLGAPYQATLTIVDNDEPAPLPEVRFSNAGYSANEGTGSIEITVLLNAASDRTVTVNYAATAGTARAGDDFVATNGTLTFVRGVTSQTFAVNIVNDAEDEADETVILALNNPGNATLGAPQQATLTIVDNDEPPPLPEVRFSGAGYSANEGAGSIEITVLLNAASDRTVTVNYAATAGTARAGDDFVATNGTLTFVRGVTSQTFAVNIVNDAEDEADETVILALNNPGNATLGAPQQATLTIVDNDEPPPPPEVRFSAATYSVNEGAGSIEIAVSLSFPSNRRISVEFDTSGGTADVGSDYTMASGTLVFEIGITSRTFSVEIVDDATDEEDETVGLALRNPANAVLGTPAEAVLAIIDNDTTPPPTSSVLLSEILPVPDETDWDGDGAVNELDEWIELYNAGAVPVDLAGWQVADDGTPYQFPADMILAPDAFLVLYRQKTGLDLGDDGDTVRLIAPSGSVVDSVTFGAIDANASYTRGKAGGWYVTPLPTPGAKPVPIES